jgi:uncharacterized protein
LIAVDTNVLVAAHRADSPHFKIAFERIRELAEGDRAWMIPWPCVHEFYAIVTHPRVFKPASSMDQAVAQLESWNESPHLHILGEGANHLGLLCSIVQQSKIVGPMVHDARIAAICRAHGATELWTADRDFSRYPWLKVRNVLVS